MKILVQKYGGTSVESIQRIKNVANRIIARKNEGYHIVVVVSAMGKHTDKLLNMANTITNNPPKRELDMLLSTGEQVSTSLLSMALNGLGYDAISFTGQQVGIKTKGYHTKSRIAEIDATRIKKSLEENKIVIVAGFQGVNDKCDITTLGRGGSDTTAVALASVLNCPCEIYTDVDGIYSIDPRLFSKAKKLSIISYEEMLEMASLGAGVMHSRAIELGQKFKVPIYVASSLEDQDGTFIRNGDEKMESTAITGLAIDNNDAMITLNYVPYNIKITASIFDAFAKKDINIDMISQTSPKDNSINISFTVPRNDLEEAKKILNVFAVKYSQISLEINKNITKLSVVGIGMRSQSGVAANMFVLLANADIEVQMVTTSEIKISYVINPENQNKAVNIIAQAYNL